jgi:hypothetical protein
VYFSPNISDSIRTLKYLSDLDGYVDLVLSSPRMTPMQNILIVGKTIKNT